MFGGDGEIYIGSTVLTDYGPVVEGSLIGDEFGYVQSIIRGKFSAADNTYNEEFAAAMCLDLGSDVELVGNYWVVAPKGSSDTPVAVPGALLGIIYDGSLKTGVVEQVGFTLSGNTAVNAGTYEAIAMLQSGYVWSDDNTKTNKTISWSIAADNTAVVDVTCSPAIAEWTDQLEFPTVTANVGNEAVLGTATWDPATITEPSAGVTNDYTVTFMVTNGNFTGSIGSATFKVYKAAGGSYPSYIPEDATVKAKYDTWAGIYGADTGSAYETAFLLNIAPDAEDQTLKEASITIEGGKVVITANQTLTSVNGKVYVKTATTLTGLTSAEWVEATLSEGKVQVTPGSSDTAGFYKIKVDF